MEERKTILHIEDKTRIKKVHFKHPKLVSSVAEAYIKDTYYQLLNKKEELNEAREKVRYLEKEIIEMEKEFKIITSDCTIEFETTDKEYTTRESDMMIKGHGNDIIGRKTIV